MVAYTTGSGGTTALVTWRPPAHSGGAPITGFTISVSPAVAKVAVGSSATEATVSGLDPHTVYVVRVAATNGSGAQSPTDQTYLVNGAAPWQVTTWETFHGGYMRTGQSAGPGPASPAVAWKWSAPAGEQIVGDPLVGPQGDIYIALTGPGSGGAPTAWVDVFAPGGGQPLWTASVSNDTAYGLTVAPDGGALLVGRAGLSHIPSGGSAADWTAAGPRFNSTFTPTAAVGPSDTTYINSTGNQISTVDPSGTVGQNSFGFGNSLGPDTGLFAFSADDQTIYLGAGNAVVMAFPGDGTATNGGWESGPSTVQAPGPVSSWGAPAVGPDGTVYMAFGSPGSGSTLRSPGYLVAIDRATGFYKWWFKTNAPVEGTPSLTATGLAVMTDTAGTVYAVDTSTGQLVWSKAVSGGSGLSSPAVARDGTIYVQTAKSVSALSNAGDLLWSTPAASPGGQSSPALGQNGDLYFVDAAGVSASDNQLVALGG